MTPLRQRMVEDMKIRHFSPDTRYRYILAVEKFAQHFDRSPERLGRERVRGPEAARDDGDRSLLDGPAR